MYKTLDETNIGAFRKDLQKALDEFASKNGMAKITMGTLRYELNGSGARCKLNCIANEAPKKIIEFTTPITVGSQFKRKRSIFTVTNMNAEKGKIGVRNQKGKNYIAKPEQLANMERIK